MPPSSRISNPTIPKIISLVVSMGGLRLGAQYSRDMASRLYADPDQPGWGVTAGIFAATISRDRRLMP
jgi:hypothetical protein